MFPSAVVCDEGRLPSRGSHQKTDHLPMEKAGRADRIVGVGDAQAAERLPSRRSSSGGTAADTAGRAGRRDGRDGRDGGPQVDRVARGVGLLPHQRRLARSAHGATPGLGTGTGRPGPPGREQDRLQRAASAGDQPAIRTQGRIVDRPGDAASCPGRVPDAPRGDRHGRRLEGVRQRRPGGDDAVRGGAAGRDVRLAGASRGANRRRRQRKRVRLHGSDLDAACLTPKAGEHASGGTHVRTAGHADGGFGPGCRVRLLTRP